MVAVSVAGAHSKSKKGCNFSETGQQHMSKVDAFVSFVYTNRTCLYKAVKVMGGVLRTHQHSNPRMIQLVSISLGISYSQLQTRYQ